MSSFLPSSALGLPASLDYKLPPSLSDDSKAYWVSVAPDGINSVSASALPIGTLAQYTSQLNAFNSQLINFTIPSGTSKSVFMDCRETSLNFRLAVQVTTATNAAMSYHNLIGSAQSFFDSLILYSNNIPIEQINGYNLLANQLLTATVNTAEKYGGIACAMGCDVNTFSGVDLPPGNATGTWYYNFSIPLISVIGINNSNHMFPIGSLNNLQLQMQTAALLPFVSYNATALTGAGAMTVTLQEFSLNLKYVDIGMDSARLLHSTLAEGKIFMKTQTWVQSSSNIPVGTMGAVNLLCQIRNSSLKSIIIQNSQATSLVTPNGQYDSINPALTQFNISIGGLNYPQKYLDVSRKPAEDFLFYLSALGFSGDYKKYSSLITRSGYGSSIPNTTTAVTTCDSSIVIPANGSRAESALVGTTQVCVSYPSQCFLGVDFEKSAGLLFNGVSSRASPPQLNYYINTPTNAATTAYAFGLVDCVLVVDTASNTIAAYV